MKQETKGVLFFNRGDKCIVRAIVALSSLRNHWSGPVTFVLEDPYPKEFVDVCKRYNVDVQINPPSPSTSALVRKTETLLSSPYDKTLWLDADVLVVGGIDEMFDILSGDVKVSTPHFAGWVSSGRTISKRIRNFEGKVSKSVYEKAFKDFPAINTGILSYCKDSKFMQDWIKLALETDGLCFISDEISFQVLYPSYSEVKICDQKYNVSVKFGDSCSDKRIIHYHGQKHCMDFPLCSLWKGYFDKMVEKDEANICYFVAKYSDKRLSKYLVQKNSGVSDDDVMKDVTVVTACDPKYVEFLRITYPTWVKYKKIDRYPMVVFVNGMAIEDERLDFLRSNKNVKLISWDMPNIDDHREVMLNAFVFGTAKNIATDYWLKLDADSYAVNESPLITAKMKEYAFCGHKWGYSKPDHIKALDAWAKNHWKRKLRTASPMISEGNIDGRRFYHKRKRTISYIQLHKTKFTKFCVGLLKEERLPAPTQDTFMFYVCDRFDPHLVGVANFKRHHGFMQGNSRLGVESLVSRISGSAKEDDERDHLDADSSEDTQGVSPVDKSIVGFEDVVSMVLEKKC